MENRGSDLRTEEKRRALVSAWRAAETESDSPRASPLTSTWKSSSSVFFCKADLRAAASQPSIQVGLVQNDLPYHSFLGAHAFHALFNVLDVDMFPPCLLALAAALGVLRGRTESRA